MNVHPSSVYITIQYLPKIKGALFGTSGRQPKAWRSTPKILMLKRQMKGCGVDPSRWEKLASDRGERRSLEQRKIFDFETRRQSELDSTRDALKAQPPAAINYSYIDGGLTCPLCARIFATKCGFARNIKAHGRR